MPCISRIVEVYEPEPTLAPRTREGGAPSVLSGQEIDATVVSHANAGSFGCVRLAPHFCL
jgi:hypothetical protein